MSSDVIVIVVIVAGLAAVIVFGEYRARKVVGMTRACPDCGAGDVEMTEIKQRTVKCMCHECGKKWRLVW